jgi:rubrerythrin
MSIKYNSDEIFEMAEEIERNGSEFYLEASDIYKEDKTCEMFKKLARMEKDHQRAFHAMRLQFGSSEKDSVTYDPDNVAVHYLQAAADMRVFNVREDVKSTLEGVDSVEKVIRLAIEREKDSVVFYVGLKRLVPDSSDAEKVDWIIEQEMEHIKILTGELAKIAK